MDRLLRASQSHITREDYPQDLMVLAEDAVIDIKTAVYIEGYKLRLLFSDNKERVVDFAPFLHDARNPAVWKYRQLNDFKNFTVAYGDLFWNDYDLCFPIADLYEGQL